MTGLGTAVRFIPRPVTIGFTNGIALLIASTQIKDFLGLKMQVQPERVLRPSGRARPACRRHGTGRRSVWRVASLAVILLVPSGFRDCRAPLSRCLSGTAATAALAAIETIGTKFGGIPKGFRDRHPAFRPDLILPLLPSAFTVRCLAAVESLSSAVVGGWDERGPAQLECGIGRARCCKSCTPLFGGIPATGAIARTATNTASGAKTPVAGHDPRGDAAWLFSPGAPGTLHPAGDAGRGSLRGRLQHGRVEGNRQHPATVAEISVWLITFVLTVFADLTVAVEVGMAPGRAALYLPDFARPRPSRRSPRNTSRTGGRTSCRIRTCRPFVTILRIHGPFLFGTTDKLAEETANLSRFAPIVHPSPPQYDGNRRHGPACAGDLLRPPEEVRPHADPLRRAQPARAVPGPNRIRRAHRKREYRAAHSGSPEPGAPDFRGLLRSWRRGSAGSGEGANVSRWAKIQPYTKIQGGPGPAFLYRINLASGIQAARTGLDANALSFLPQGV